LYAATAPSIQGGDFIGPDGRGNRRGYPTRDATGARLYDEEASKKLWTVSEQLTGVTYSFGTM
jgi:hypothetical protein